MCAAAVFEVAAHVEDDDRPVVADLGEVGEGGPREGARAASPPAQSAGLPVACAAGRSMPMRDQFPLGLGDLRPGCSPSRVSGVPQRDEPAEVGGEAAVQAEVERAGDVPGGERDPVAQVDHPFAGGEALADLLGVGPFGQVRSGRRRAGAVGRGHVGVVGGPGVQAGEQFVDERSARRGSARG